MVFHEDLLMVRTLHKKWTKLWCVLSPGTLLLYSSSEAKVLPSSSIHQQNFNTPTRRHSITCAPNQRSQMCENLRTRKISLNIPYTENSLHSTIQQDTNSSSVNLVQRQDSWTSLNPLPEEQPTRKTGWSAITTIPEYHRQGNDWVGTVILRFCELMEHPSKIDGFCFTLFHSLEQSIWATIGPEGQPIGSALGLLPSNHIILLSPSEAERKSWMDALEIEIRSPSLPSSTNVISYLSESQGLHESDYENAFKDLDLNDKDLTNKSNQHQQESDHLSGSESEDESGSYITAEEGEIEEACGFCNSILPDQCTCQGGLAFGDSALQTQNKKKKVYIMNFIKFPKSIIMQCGVEMKLELRQGAAKDSENLLLTFTKLGYEVSLHENMSTDETNNFLDDIAQDKSLQFLLLFVLSHGVDRDTFFLSDGSQ